MFSGIPRGKAVSTVVPFFDYNFNRVSMVNKRDVFTQLLSDDLEFLVTKYA